jgi:ABC-type amino acid transport system permease subunit
VDYEFDWNYIWDSRLPLLHGLLVTLEVSAIGIALAIIVGVAGAFVRLFAVRGHIHLVMFAFQALLQESGQSFIIFGNKNSHNVNCP